MSQYEDELVGDILNEYNARKNNRCTFEGHWQEVAELVAPSFINTFFDWGEMIPGSKKTEKQIDAKAMVALGRFGAIVDSLLTPRNSTWHGLEASDPVLNKNRNVKMWFEDTTRRLFKTLRYAPTANFSSQNQQLFKSLGAFGTGPMFVDRLYSMDGTKGFRYKCMALGNVYISENHQGIVDGVVRRFKLTARQAMQRAEWDATLPQAIKDKAKTAPEHRFSFLQCVKPRTDYNPERLDAKGKMFGSYYISLDYKKLLSEGGYNTFPMPTSRYEQDPEEAYGRGPAMQVLPAIKTKNVEKRILLKQGHRSVDQVLLMHDDGLAAFSLKPGAQNPGTVNADGKPLVVPLPGGSVQIGLEMMQEEDQLIDSAFLVDLFKLLLDDPKIFTATQVTEMIAQRGILISPTVGRQQSEYLGPLIDRELDLGADMGLFLPMPPELIEAKGDYSVVYTSPLARAARAEEVAGLQRSLERALNVVNITQNPAPLDHFDWDTIIPEAAEIDGVPTRWMRDPRMIDAIRTGRQQVKQAAMENQAAPGAAALIKAQAMAGGGKQKATAR